MAASKKSEPRRETGVAIDREYLEVRLKNVQAQKENARDVFHQAEGAEQAILSLLEHLQESPPETQK